MKRLLIVTLFGLLSANAFASAPDSYQLKLGEGKAEYYVPVVLKDTLTFDYWFDGVSENTTARLTVWSQDPEISYNGKTYGPYTEYLTLRTNENSDGWQRQTVEVPFQSLITSDGYRRTDQHFLSFDIGSTSSALPTLYVNNISSYDTGRDIGYPVNNDQPVPEPGTWAMITMGILSFAGFKFSGKRYSR